MQTFLPYPSFEISAKALDRTRLGKQRVEALQILRAITGLSKGWQRHPAVNMWRGYEFALIRYAQAVCREWTGRGYKDTCSGQISDIGAALRMSGIPNQGDPPWLGDVRFHRSHRSALFRKAPSHYGPIFGPDDPAITSPVPYFWPVS